MRLTDAEIGEKLDNEWESIFRHGEQDCPVTLTLTPFTTRMYGLTGTSLKLARRAMLSIEEVSNK